MHGVITCHAAINFMSLEKNDFDEWPCPCFLSWLLQFCVLSRVYFSFCFTYVPATLNGSFMYYSVYKHIIAAHNMTLIFNSSPPGQDGRHFADDTFRCIFVKEKFCILVKIWLKFVPQDLIDKNPALVQIMACHIFSTKPLSKPVLRCCQLDPEEQTSVKF